MVGVSSVGKRGELLMRFERDGSGRSILREMYRRAPVIVQQALYFDEQLPQLPCVYILSAGGPVVEGDEYDYEIALKEGSCAHISTGAATKVAQMRGGRASLQQRFSLAEGSYMEYLPELTIPCSGASYEVECRAVVAPSAVLFYSDIFMCGRLHSGERYRYERLDLSTRILRPDGELIFCERQVVEPAYSDVDNLAVMGGMELFASVVIIAPADVCSALYDSIMPKMEPNLSLGVHLLPSGAGIVCRIAGRESGAVKHQVRELCSLLRQRLYGVGMPAEFPWR